MYASCLRKSFQKTLFVNFVLSGNNDISETFEFRVNYAAIGSEELEKIEYWESQQRKKDCESRGFPFKRRTEWLHEASCTDESPFAESH